MKINPTSQSVCRTPAFAMQTSFVKAWPLLKNMIAAASPDFYKQIAELEVNDIKFQSERIQFTIWKYFNRSRYRSTPFGQFAAISLVPNHEKTQEALQLEQALFLYQWPCWTAIPNQLPKGKQLHGALFRTNPVCYADRTAYRYLFKEQSHFTLTAIPNWDEITIILEFCRELRSFTTIAQYLEKNYAIEIKRCTSLLTELLALQVIQCNLQANITGEDYFNRRSFLPIKPFAQYTIASRNVLAGAVPLPLLKDVPAYLKLMSGCLPIAPQEELEKFKADFTQRWEKQAIPLSLVMDPLLGIGYGHRHPISETELIRELGERAASANVDHINYGAFQQFLLNEMMKGQEIKLESYQQVNNDNSAQKLPNTLSVQLYFYGNSPVIENAGGASATSLLGRFTLIPPYQAYGKELVQLEKSANPNVVFFDMAYTFEGKVDNINRRQHLYDTELVFSGWSTSETPLQLANIMVSIAEGEVVLHCRISGKRLVPRLSSAYNYKRSDLAHFRFLSDLQHQNHCTAITVDLQRFFPGLATYPRVCYKSCIVSPAKWLLPTHHTINALKKWLNERAIKDLIKVGTGDQTLVIDPQSEQDLRFLLLYQKNQAQPVYLSEALISEQPMVKDEYNNSYCAQFIVDYYHTEQCYHTYHYEQTLPKERDLVMPGAEWLYLELYLHPLVTEQFLDQEIKTLIKSQQQHLKQWFFIHYHQPDHHLRLRLKLKDPQYLPMLLQQINSLMDISQYYGLLKEIQIKGYEREIHRYGIEQMDRIEYFFYLDSRLALLHINKPIKQRYEIILGFVMQLCERLYKEPKEQVLFFKTMAEVFAAEMKFDQHHFKKINKSSKEYQPKRIVNRQIFYLFDKIIAQYKAEKQQQILADLIHLHINRRFSDQQRLHEAILYQYLYKQSLQWQLVG